MDNKNCKIELLNTLANIYPFSLFIIDISNPPEKLQALTEDINRSPLRHKLNTNDIIIIQMIINIIGIFITALLILLKSKGILKLTTANVIYTFSVIELASISVKAYVKFLLKQYKRSKINSIPIINNYIITMLKGDKVVSEILYSLTVIETPYKDNFIRGYELYNKNNREGIKYLQEIFKDTYFKETLKVLGDYSKYDKSISLKYLKRISKIIKRQINNLKKKKFDIGFIYSQASVVFPLGLIGLLVLLPVMSVAFDAIKTSMIK